MPTQDVWQYSPVYNGACKVIEKQTLWGQAVCGVWLPNQDAVVRLPRSALRLLDADLQPEIGAGRIATAAMLVEVLEGSTSATDGYVVLTPMESNVLPLANQTRALSRAISGDRVHYQPADEVVRSRREAIERVGLRVVRQFRLSHCSADESEWRQELQSARQIVPEIRPLLMLRSVEGALNE